MTNYKWRSNPNIIARLVDGNDIKTWKARQVVLKPNEACAFIIDGRIGDIVSEKIVRNIGGGIGRHIADLMVISIIYKCMVAKLAQLSHENMHN